MICKKNLYVTVAVVVLIMFHQSILHSTENPLTPEGNLLPKLETLIQSPQNDDSVRDIISKNTNLVNCTFEKQLKGLTPLAYVAKEGRSELIDFLIEKGANVNAVISVQDLGKNTILQFILQDEYNSYAPSQNKSYNCAEHIINWILSHKGYRSSIATQVRWLVDGGLVNKNLKNYRKNIRRILWKYRISQVKSTASNAWNAISYLFSKLRRGAKHSETEDVQTHKQKRGKTPPQVKFEDLPFDEKFNRLLSAVCKTQQPDASTFQNEFLNFISDKDWGLLSEHVDKKVILAYKNFNDINFETQLKNFNIDSNNINAQALHCATVSCKPLAVALLVANGALINGQRTTSSRNKDNLTPLDCLNILHYKNTLNKVQWIAYIKTAILLLLLGGTNIFTKITTTYSVDGTTKSLNENIINTIEDLAYKNGVCHKLGETTESSNYDAAVSLITSDIQSKTGTNLNDNFKYASCWLKYDLHQARNAIHVLLKIPLRGGDPDGSLKKKIEKFINIMRNFIEKNFAFLYEDEIKNIITVVIKIFVNIKYGNGLRPLNHLEKAHINTRKYLIECGAVDGDKPVTFTNDELAALT